MKLQLCSGKTDLEPSLAPKKRLPVNLAHSSLGQPDRLADLLHRQLFTVIEGQDELFLLRELRDHFRELCPNLPPFRQRQGIFPFHVGKVLEEIAESVFVLSRTEVLEPDLESGAALPHGLMVIVERDAEGLGNLGILREPPERPLEHAVGALHGVHPIPRYPRQEGGRRKLDEHGTMET